MPQELADIICKTEVGEEREMSDNNEDIDNEDGYYDELKLTMLILTMWLMCCLKRVIMKMRINGKYFCKGNV